MVEILIAACSFIGLRAASVAIRAWKSYVIPQRDRLRLTSIFGTALFGGLAAILPAPVIASVWGILLWIEWRRIAFLRWACYFGS